MDTRGAQVYTIDATSSQLHILVFRGGTLARLGHNHVISADRIRGRVWVHSDPSRSAFELFFPVARLIVDDAEARRAAGAEFGKEVPEKDKEATRRNMLGPDVLDAERYPEVRIVSARISGDARSPHVTALITLKDVTREVEVPAQVSIDGERLTARGELSLRQSEFGIEPFKVGFGALQVQDELHIRYKLVAVRER
ncbi:MAG TPA: YceI family protein [Steroidobacter sp.]